MLPERKEGREELKQTLDSLRKSVGRDHPGHGIRCRDERFPIQPVIRSEQRILPELLPRRWIIPQEKIDGIRMAGSIHDIGKLSIPAEICVQAYQLTDLEFSLIKSTPIGIRNG